MRSHRRWSLGVAIGLAVLSVGCQGGGGDGNGGVTPPAAAITVSLSAASLTVRQGEIGTVTTTVARVNGFTGDVNVTVENAPDGVTPTYTPSTISAGSTSSTLEISVAMTAIPGTYTLTVRGRGTGNIDDTETLSLTILAAGGFTMSVSTPTVSVQQGGSGAASVTIARAGGYALPITLTTSGAPAGMAVVLTPTTLLGSATVVDIAITVAPSVAAASYPVAVQANAAGLTERTATITVQVTGGSSGTSVTIQLCDRLPSTFFAVQSDGGAWTSVGGIGGAYTFSVGSRGAVAVMTRLDEGLATSVIYASGSELAEFGRSTVASCAHPQLGSKHLSGQVAGLTASQAATVTIGDAYAVVEGGGSPVYSFDIVPDGPSDLIAARDNLLATGSTLGMIVDKLIVRRGLNLPTWSTIPTLNFAGPEAFAPTLANVTLGNAGGDTVAVLSELYTATNTIASLSLTFGTAQQQPFGGLPGTALAPGDLHEIFAMAIPTLDANHARGAVSDFRSVTDQTLTFGPALAEPTISAASTSSPLRFRAQLPVQPEYRGVFYADYEQTINWAYGDVYHEVTLYVTAAYLGGSPTTWDATIPDLSSAGYDPQWGLVEGSDVFWTVTASNETMLRLAGLVPADGARAIFASRGNMSENPIALRAVPRRQWLARPLPLRTSPFRMSIRPRR